MPCCSDLFEVRTETTRKTQEREAASIIKDLLQGSLQRAIDLAQEKGALSWPAYQPIVGLGFSLHKRAFRDARAPRYGRSPTHTPIHCSCGVPFSVQHALSCPKGGFPTLRHNEVRDFTAKVLFEVCHNVCVEPHLQPLSGKTLDETSAITANGARLDVAASGF